MKQITNIEFSLYISPPTPPAIVKLYADSIINETKHRFSYMIVHAKLLVCLILKLFFLEFSMHYYIHSIMIK